MPLLESLLVGVATGVSANKAYDAAKKYCRNVLGYEENDLVKKLYSCFDTAFEKYCTKHDYLVGGYANCFLLHSENWEIIVDILNFNTQRMKFENINRNSVCGNYQATDYMVEDFIRMMEDEISADMALSNSIQEKKLLLRIEGTIEDRFNELSLKIDEAIDNKPIAKMDHFPFRVNISANDIEGNIEELLNHDGYLEWLGIELFSATRKVILELAINAVSHGKADNLKIRVNRSSIEIHDNGTSFNPKDSFIKGKTASTSNGFGAEMLREFLFEYPNTVSLTSTEKDNVNITAINFTNAESFFREKCEVSIESNNTFSREVVPIFPLDCDTYFYQSTRRMATSQSHGAIQAVLNNLPDKKSLVVRVEDRMERRVFKKRFIGHPRVIIE
ncbi:hypothetical protein [uncultured Shewanella sp.]|uniref:hypothetical protein n=1 Tax=uncultured Shewanella sp. TaxID=173975 RepID=UPI002619855E|nr:hypothetical protein [uncultured Shewanella sp.]